MSDFKQFKQAIRAKGGIWASDDVYFSSFRDGYSAGYLPNYPQKSDRDESIYSAGLISGVEGSLHVKH